MITARYEQRAREAIEDEVVSVVLCPAVEWQALFRAEGAAMESLPVVAWGVQRGGTVVALVVEEDGGCLSPVDSYSNFAGLSLR